MPSAPGWSSLKRGVGGNTDEMNVSAMVWALTIALIVGLVAFDFIFHVRKAHVPTLREAGIWSALYVGVAVVFGVAVMVFGGTTMGAQYFAGYLTEKALSVDNLFVFLVIIASFAVPHAYQQKVLLFGIVFSLITRTGFIFIGAALINTFAWMFYVFGLILLLTAASLIKPSKSEGPGADNIVVRLATRALRTSENYDGDRLFTVESGKRMLTPVLLVTIAIGGTDILFALDSVPAIFGLTQNTYVVFTATAFSLLGLRQLYFLIDGLLDRLVYLSYGLAAILGFIGAKLILGALHQNNVPIINSGQPVDVAEIGTGLSLSVIISVLAITTMASLMSPRGRAQTAVARARRHATAYLDVHFAADAEEREQIFGKLCAEEETIKALPPKYRARIREEHDLMGLIRRAHAAHDAHMSGSASDR